MAGSTKVSIVKVTAEPKVIECSCLRYNIHTYVRRATAGKTKNRCRNKMKTSLATGRTRPALLANQQKFCVEGRDAWIMATTASHLLGFESSSIASVFGPDDSQILGIEGNNPEICHHNDAALTFVVARSEAGRHPALVPYA